MSALADSAAAGRELRLEPLPPDHNAAVVAVASALAGDTPSNGPQPAERRLVLSARPPDRVAPVQAVAEAAALVEVTVRDVPLSAKEAEYRDELGDEPDPERPALDAEVPQPLDNQSIYRIVREVALADSGDDLYGAVSTDQADRVGLAFGLVLFTQASGHLGSALKLMRAREAATFAEVFGPAQAELVDVTTAATREARLGPVGGAPLWSGDWLERFRRAGEVSAFQAAQNEEAIEGLFRPMLPIALGLGLATDRALALAFDRVVVRGVGGGLRYVVEAAGALRTAAQRAAALELLGAPTLAAFQASAGLARRDGTFDPATHAALVAALRRQGKVPLPSASDLVGRLVDGARGPARERLARLRDSDAFSDMRFVVT